MIHQRQHSNVLTGVAITVIVVVLCTTAAMANTADEMFTRGLKLANNGDYKEAVQAMLDFQDKYPGDQRVPRAQYLVGRYQHTRNYLNNALQEYEYVVKDFSKSQYAAKARHRMADIYIHKDQYDKAAKQLKQCAEEFEEAPIGFHALRRLGDVYLKMNQPNMASETFNQLIQYNVLALRQDQPRDIKRQVERDIHRGVMYLADKAIKNKNYDKARNIYSRLPDMWEKVRLTIDLLYRQEKFDEIHNLVNKMQDDNYWQAQGILLEFYLRQGSVHGLKTLIRDLSEEHEQNRQLSGLFKQLLTGMEEFSDEEKADIYELVATKYRPLRRTFEYEVCKLVKDDKPDVLKSFITTYQSGKDVEQCKRWRGIYLELNDEPEEAREQYQQMADEAQGHFFIAETYHGKYARQAGNMDRDQALQEYMKIRKTFYDTESTCQAYWRIAHLQVDMGQKNKAIDTLEEMEQRFFGQSDWQVKARMQIADWYRQWNDYKKAVDAYRKVDRNYPDTRQQRLALYRIGLCYEQMEKKDKAIQAFLECIRRFDKSKIQSRAHTRLEVKYEIPDLIIRDMIDEQE